MSVNVTRESLALTIAEKIGLKIGTARKFVDLTVARMSDGVVQDEKLMLSNFGTFQVQTKKERIERNPRTGETVIIAPRRIVSFRQAQTRKAGRGSLSKTDHS
jgi:integration host factor subunit alpha